jgi:hypothetical protein
MTQYIIINTLTNLPRDNTAKDKDTLVRYANPGLVGVTLLYDWAVHHLTVRVGYNTPLLSDGGLTYFLSYSLLLIDFTLTRMGISKTRAPMW